MRPSDFIIWPAAIIGATATGVVLGGFTPLGFILVAVFVAIVAVALCKRR